MGGMGLLVHVHLDVSVVTGPGTLRGFILMSLWFRYSEMICQFMFMSLLSRYIEEHIQKTGVAIETQGFTFITSGRKRESLTVRSVYYCLLHFCNIYCCYNCRCTLKMSLQDSL